MLEQPRRPEPRLFGGPAHPRRALRVVRRAGVSRWQRQPVRALRLGHRQPPGWVAACLVLGDVLRPPRGPRQPRPSAPGASPLGGGGVRAGGWWRKPWLQRAQRRRRRAAIPCCVGALALDGRFARAVQVSLRARLLRGGVQGVRSALQDVVGGHHNHRCRSGLPMLQGRSSDCRGVKNYNAGRHRFLFRQPPRQHARRTSCRRCRWCCFIRKWRRQWH